MVGKISVKRSLITTFGVEMFACHTSIRDTSFNDQALKASFVIIHGLAENSDLFIEPALLYALNGFHVHLIDLRGYGLSAGVRMAQNKISDYHHEISAVLKEANPTLPLFIYGHSMGGLTLTTFLTNNPHLNIAGVILSAPLLEFHESFKIDFQKKLMLRLIAPHFEVEIYDIINYFFFRNQLSILVCHLILFAEIRISF